MMEHSFVECIYSAVHQFTKYSQYSLDDTLYYVVSKYRICICSSNTNMSQLDLKKRQSVVNHQLQKLSKKIICHSYYK